MLHTVEPRICYFFIFEKGLARSGEARARRTMVDEYNQNTLSGYMKFSIDKKLTIIVFVVVVVLRQCYTI